VSFFDAASLRLIGSLETLAEPHELCFDPARRLLWCANTYHSGYYHASSGRRSQLTVIDPDTRPIVEVVDIAPELGPHGLSLDLERGRLYVSVEGTAEDDGGVVGLDAVARKPIGRIAVGAFGPHWFVVSPDGTRGYAGNKEAPFVSVLDLVEGELIDRIEVPGGEGLTTRTGSQSTTNHHTVAPPTKFYTVPVVAGGRLGDDALDGPLPRALPACAPRTRDAARLRAVGGAAMASRAQRRRG
jgi:DNA-binding beta-propeller fold protein YncE